MKAQGDQKLLETLASIVLSEEMWCWKEHFLIQC